MSQFWVSEASGVSANYLSDTESGVLSNISGIGALARKYPDVELHSINAVIARSELSLSMSSCLLDI
jgi:hypothetical protein